MSAPQAPASITADLDIDVTGEICPMTFVRTRLALDRLLPGQVLGVTTSGGEPARNVPATARAQGHAVLGEWVGIDGGLRVLIRKKAVLDR